jgi:hypothetical protein
MKLSTMTLVMCFALAPFAAHATAPHHHAIHQAQRHAISMTATAFAPVVIPVVKLDDDFRRVDAQSRGMQSRPTNDPP